MGAMLFFCVISKCLISVCLNERIFYFAWLFITVVAILRILFICWIKSPPFIIFMLFTTTSPHMKAVFFLILSTKRKSFQQKVTVPTKYFFMPITVISSPQARQCASSGRCSTISTGSPSGIRLLLFYCSGLNEKLPLPEPALPGLEVGTHSVEVEDRIRLNNIFFCNTPILTQEVCISSGPISLHKYRLPYGK